MRRVCFARVPHRLCLFAVLALSRVPTVAGVLVAHHAGASDPTNEGFSLSFGGGAQVGGVNGDLGLDAWSIELNGASDAAIYARYLTGEEQANAAVAGWAMSLRLRTVAYPVAPPNGLMARFYTGTRLYSLRFGAQADGDPVVYAEEASGSRSYTLESGGAGYHDYTLVYDAGAGSAALAIDGLESMSALTGRSLPSAARFDWGGGQTIGHVNWNEVSLVIVPEPSCPVLVLLGGGALLARRRPSWVRHRLLRVA